MEITGGLPLSAIRSAAWSAQCMASAGLALNSNSPHLDRKGSPGAPRDRRWDSAAMVERINALCPKSLRHAMEMVLLDRMLECDGATVVEEPCR